MKTKTLIIACFIELFCESGFEGTSMAAVAEKTGIKKASLYAHFTSKKALFIAACEVILAQVTSEILLLQGDKTKNPDEKLFDLLHFFCIKNANLSPHTIQFINRLFVTEWDNHLELRELEAEYLAITQQHITSIFDECLAMNYLLPENRDRIQSAYTFLFHNLIVHDAYSATDLRNFWEIFWPGHLNNEVRL